MSLPIITLTSSSNTNVNRNSSYNRSSRILRDPSFSSYLNGAEEAFVLKLRSTGAREFGAIPHDHVLDAEIDVFDAEKYFSESYDSEIDALPSHCIKKYNQFEMFASKPPPPWIATARIGSESSWNSHPMLLQPTSSKKKNNFLASIGSRCSCRDNISVSIDNFDAKKKNNSIKNSPLDSRSDGREMRVRADVHFSFPVFNKDDDRRQIPFRAFASPILGNGKYRFSDIPDESDSYASSDLFEIESFSMQASDGCVTPRAGYAPSEASIEWSVVTASAADFSALSDTEEVRSNAAAAALSQPKMYQNRKMPKPRSSILSGCSNYKAVNVAKSHRACGGKARFSDKDNIPGFGRRDSEHCVVSKPHNGSAPHLLYT